MRNITEKKKRFEAPSVVFKPPPTWYQVTEFDPQQSSGKRHPLGMGSIVPFHLI